MDDHGQKNILEPIESAPKEVQAIIRRVLELEKANIYKRSGVTPDEIVQIIKEIIK